MLPFSEEAEEQPCLLEEKIILVYALKQTAMLIP
jgi:hypothetical protein